MLYDAQFLRELDKQIERTTYVRIQVLTLDERPIDTLQGRTTSGSINIDGKSAIRRSCSLSFVSELKDINNFYWTFKRKFRAEIGLENKINNNYPSIIWFPLGTFFITSFNATVGVNNCSISIQGKDKMCLLNGELGGVINAETDFGSVDETDIYGETTNKKLEIKEIIENLIYTYAQEPLSNIIIQDLDLAGLELLDYKYDDPLYLVRPVGSKLYSIPIFEKTGITVYAGENYSTPVLISDDSVMVYDSLLNIATDSPTVFALVPPTEGEDRSLFCAAKITYGEAVGYRICPLVYAGELIAKSGDTVTSVLDKIVKMLGEYEYFYDVDGHFVFRRKKSFINTVWTPKVTTMSGNEYYNPYYRATPYSYIFKDNSLITNISNQPRLDNIKNDYTVWGERDGGTGGKIPIHGRYAIDKKPILYVSVAPGQPIKAWTTAKNNLELKQGDYPIKLDIQYGLDWRELIYQMAIEYRRYSRASQELEYKDYTLQLARRNPIYFPTGHTGYEQYYTDMEGFWRQLYYPFDDVSPVVYYKPHKDEDINQTYMQGVYRPNVKLIPSYPANTKDQIHLEENEKIVGPYDNYIWVINTNQYYYYDDMHNGFAMPNPETDLNKYISGDMVVKSLNDEQSKISFNTLNHMYTLDSPLISQKIYINDDRYEEDKLIVPIMDLFDYVPIDYCQQLQRKLNWIYGSDVQIANFYTPQYDNYSEKAYVKIDENYQGSKYNIYTLDKINETASSIYNDLNVIKNLIAELLERNSSNFLHWPQFQEQLKNVNYKSFVEWLENATKNQIDTADDIKLLTNLMLVYLINYSENFISESIRSFKDILKTIRIDDNIDLETESPVNLFLYCVLYRDNLVLTPEEEECFSFSSQMQLNNVISQLNITDVLIFLRFISGINQNLTNLYSIEGAEHVLQVALNIAGNNNSEQLDFNGDHTVDVKDALWLSRYASGLINELPFNNPVNWNNINYSPQILTGLLIWLILGLSDASYQAVLDTSGFADSLIESYEELPEEFWLKYRNSSILQNLLQEDTAFKQLKILTFLYYSIVQEHLDELAEAALVSPNYTLFSDIVNQIMPLVSNSTNNEIKKKLIMQWQQLFVYDSTNYYSLEDLRQSEILAKIYGLDTMEIVPYSIHGEPEYLSAYQKTLHYYIREFQYYDSSAGDKAWWNKQVFTDPQSLNFWFDFLDVAGSEVGGYAVNEIGDRSIVINETGLKSILYRETPKMIIMDSEAFRKLKPQDIKTGYSYVLFPQGYESFFSISSRGLSIKNRIDELVYQHTYCQQQINLTAIPIYYLDVNQRIKLIDPQTRLNCDCAIQSLNYSLNYNGTMTINVARIQPNSIFEREE